jgi:hypothetical protein
LGDESCKCNNVLTLPKLPLLGFSMPWIHPLRQWGTFRMRLGLVYEWLGQQEVCVVNGAGAYVGSQGRS